VYSPPYRILCLPFTQVTFALPVYWLSRKRNGLAPLLFPRLENPVRKRKRWLTALQGDRSVRARYSQHVPSEVAEGNVVRLCPRALPRISEVHIQQKVWRERVGRPQPDILNAARGGPWLPAIKRSSPAAPRSWGSVRLSGDMLYRPKNVVFSVGL